MGLVSPHSQQVLLGTVSIAIVENSPGSFVEYRSKCLSHTCAHGPNIVCVSYVAGALQKSHFGLSAFLVAIFITYIFAHS